MLTIKDKIEEFVLTTGCMEKFLKDLCYSPTVILPNLYYFTRDPEKLGYFNILKSEIVKLVKSADIIFKNRRYSDLKMTIRNTKIVKYYYLQNLEYREIAKLVDLSSARVRDIVQIFLNKLRSPRLRYFYKNILGLCDLSGVLIESRIIEKVERREEKEKQTMLGKMFLICKHALLKWDWMRKNYDYGLNFRTNKIRLCKAIPVIKNYKATCSFCEFFNCSNCVLSKADSMCEVPGSLYFRWSERLFEIEGKTLSNLNLLESIKFAKDLASKIYFLIENIYNFYKSKYDKENRRVLLKRGY